MRSAAPNNLELWHSVEKTDPAHVKPITGKSYGGNSPKPHWLVLKATETFGPCGIGWGFTIVDERIENGSDGDRMSFARVRVWYDWQGKRGEVEHVGGTPFSGKRKTGVAFADEDAPKKSVTDALVKALSLIGFAGDIFLGRWDDSRYQADLREEFSPAARKSNVVFAAKEQITDLKAEIKRAGRDIARVLTHFGVDRIELLSIDQAKTAIETIRAMPNAKVPEETAA